ncbi:MAG TPA: hypothetical protein VL282_03730 [Tepidisphaeraceae bacterium]|nr:hypothetical protein [Tepidisphaeraceae bacterium]
MKGFAVLLIALLVVQVAHAVEISYDSSFKSPPLDQLPSGATIRLGSRTWDGLVSRSAPTFAWNDSDLMWIRYDEKHQLQFELDHAIILKPKHAAATVALLDVTNCAPGDYIQEFSRDTARVVKERPPGDGGPGTHALLLSRHTDGAELYDVIWQSATMGSGVWRSLRHIYILRDADGQWRFGGEGPSELDGHGFCSALDFDVQWTGNPESPIRIFYSFFGCDNEASESPTKETMLTTRREAILEGSLPGKVRWLNEEHHLVDVDETFENLVRSIAEWRGNLRTGDPDEPQSLLVARRLLLAKNPFLIHRIAIPGTFVVLPDYNEVSRARMALTTSRRK